MTRLHEEGNWQLLPSGRHNKQIQSYILHVCPDAGAHYYWYSRNMDGACNHCGEYVATGVLGLWRLHNFEWIGTWK